MMNRTVSSASVRAQTLINQMEKLGLEFASATACDASARLVQHINPENAADTKALFTDVRHLLCSSTVHFSVALSRLTSPFRLPTPESRSRSAPRRTELAIRAREHQNVINVELRLSVTDCCLNYIGKAVWRVARIRHSYE